MPIELDRIRIFDVLRNSLNGELGLVMSVTGDHMELRDKTGAISRYKFGKQFAPVTDDEAIAFRAALRALRKAQPPEKKRKRTLSAFLNKLAKRKR